MQITIKTFAQTREISQVPVLELSVPQDATVDDVIVHLKSLSEPWARALDGSILTACNQQLCNGTQALAENDEVAFFPPVTGG